MIIFFLPAVSGTSSPGSSASFDGAASPMAGSAFGSQADEEELENTKNIRKGVKVRKPTWLHLETLDGRGRESEVEE
jgi:hypothetical protein